MKTLLLIDANSIIHRCFHALPPLTARDGRPAQALYGLASVLIRLFREERPEYAAACFDRPEPTFRETEYPAYKAQRPPTPDALIAQIIEAHTLFRKFGVRTFEKAGFEADDLIADFARKFGGSTRLTAGAAEDSSAVILTGDLDTLQLVRDGNITVRAFQKGISETTLYDEAAVKARYGLEPKQLVDYKAFVGDASDNIKGVPGIGPKTARELLERFGTLESVYKHLDQLSERTRAVLAAARDQALLSKRMVTLQNGKIADSLHIEDLRVGFDEPSAKDYLSDLGFATLVARLEGKNGSRKTSAGSTQGAIF